MKIDKSKMKKGLSEVPGDCKQLIEHLMSCSADELNELLKTKSWNYGDCDLNVLIDRLEYDVDMCRKDQPFEIEIKLKRRDSQDLILSELEAGEQQQTSMEVDNEVLVQPGASSAGASASSAEPAISAEEKVLIDRQLIQKQQQLLASGSKELQCYPQRAAVLKSILNFLKKAIQDAAFSDSIRHLMDGSLPKSLKHIISNAEYYGPSLFMLATDVVTVYVVQEPSLLSSLQENGLTDVILHALLTKDIPATKEVLASLPNVFGVLCLNSCGLESFKSFRPFDKIFKLLLSPDCEVSGEKELAVEAMIRLSFQPTDDSPQLSKHQSTCRSGETYYTSISSFERVEHESEIENFCANSVKSQSTNISTESCPLSKMNLEDLSYYLKTDLSLVLCNKVFNPLEMVIPRSDDLSRLYRMVFEGLRNTRSDYPFPHEETAEDVRTAYIRSFLCAVVKYFKDNFKLKPKFPILEVESGISMDGKLVRTKSIKPDLVVKARPPFEWGPDVQRSYYVFVVEMNSGSSGSAFRQLSVYSQTSCTNNLDEERVFALASNGLTCNLVSFDPKEGFKMSVDLEFMFGQMFDVKTVQITKGKGRKRGKFAKEELYYELWVENCKPIIDLVFAAFCEKLEIQ